MLGVQSTLESALRKKHHTVIVVLDGARLVEVGTHDELMAKGGQHAELYGIQATAYR